MEGILEAIPNFSEGREARTITSLAEALDSVPGARLLNVDADPDANRSVYTLAGEPQAVAQACLRAAERAQTLIDMRTQRGTHPRLGALDVMPFVPIAGIGMDEAKLIAQDTAARLGERGIPVFLYEESAAKPERRLLSDIRRGEYESLARRLGNGQDRPDFGPDAFVPRWGASVCGAREALVAWNVNLIPADGSPAGDGQGALRSARAIASEIRAQGKEKPPFPRLKAIGWYLESRSLAQLSCNVMNLGPTSLGQIYAAVDAAARARGLKAAGSELIGLCPARALGLEAPPPPRSRTEPDWLGRLHAAWSAIGLERYAPCPPEDRVLELALRRA